MENVSGPEVAPGCLPRGCPEAPEASARPHLYGHGAGGKSYDVRAPLKVRTSRDDSRTPRRSVDASLGIQACSPHVGGQVGPPPWVWRTSYTGQPPPHIYGPDSPKLAHVYPGGIDSARGPSSPVALPVAMAYPAVQAVPPPGYVMFPVMLSGAPDSPRGGLTPLMGSPVGTPTAMMFPQTPFAQHTPGGPFAPPPGPGPTSLRAGSVSGAPPGATNEAYFHPLFNGFNGFGAAGGNGMPPGYNVPQGPMGGQAPKVARNSGPGDKGRAYTPSPLKPGPRKSWGNAPHPHPAVVAHPHPAAAAQRPNGAATNGAYGASGAYQPTRQQYSSASVAAAYQAHARSAAAAAAAHAAAADEEVGSEALEDEDEGVVSPPSALLPSPQQPAAPVSPDPPVPAFSSGSARVSATSLATPRDTTPLDTRAAVAAAVVAAAAAAVSLSAGPTPRTSMSGTGAALPNMQSGATLSASASRLSLNGLPVPVAPSARTSCSGIAALPSASAAAAALNAAVAGAVSPLVDHVTADEDFDADGVGLAAGDVEGPSYGTHGGAYGGNSAAAMQAAAMQAAAWGFYDGGLPAGSGLGSPQMWPGGAHTRMYASPQMLSHMAMMQQTHGSPHHHGVTHGSHHSPQHPNAMSAASMLQQLAAAASVPVQVPVQMAMQGGMTSMAGLQQGMAAAMPCYMAGVGMPAAGGMGGQLDASDPYMMAEHLAQLQALQGSIIAQHNLRAAAAAAAVASAADMAHHPAMGMGGMGMGMVHGAGGLGGHGGLLMSPGMLSGALSHTHAAHAHALHAGALAGHSHGGHHTHHGMAGVYSSPGGGPGRNRRSHGSMGSGGGPSSGGGAGAAGGEGQVRLNARQRRTLRRAKERAIRGLLEAGKLLVQRTMGEDGEDGEDSAGELPSGDGAYDSEGDEGEEGGDSGDVETEEGVCSPTRPLQQQQGGCESAHGGLAEETGAAAGSPASCASASGASSVCDAAHNGSSFGGAYSKASSTEGIGLVDSAPSSGKASPLSAAGAAAVAAAAAAAPASADVVPVAGQSDQQASPAVRTPVRPVAAGDGSMGASPVSAAALAAAAAAGASPVDGATSAAAAAAAALASGAASDADIASLIQQLSLKREGLVDEKLMRDLEIINNLIGALKTAGGAGTPAAPSGYNAQGRKPVPPHGQGHGGHTHGSPYTPGPSRVAKGYAVGY